MESLKKKKERLKIIYETLDPLYTYEKTALKYRTPFQLLVATILSAQCTDRQVNKVTRDLFKKYKKPEDYVIATGETHSVREFVERAAEIAGFSLVWEGEGVNEKGIDSNSGKVFITLDPRYWRPAEVDLLCGDSSKARSILGWKPEITFNNLVQNMMLADLKLISKNPGI